MRTSLRAAPLVVLVACTSTVPTITAPDAAPPPGADASPADASPADAGPAADGGPRADSGPGPSASFPLASLDDTCDGVATLTGRSLVRLLAVKYDATYTPRTGAATPLEMKVKYEGGAIVCFPHFKSNGGAPDMPARIELAIRVDFETDDGTFKEDFDGKITSRFGGTTLDLSASLPIARVKGRYVATPMPGFDKIDLGIGGTLGPGSATSGNVMQWGTISAPPQPGQINPGKTEPAGSWK